jgi:hypothetical protein
MYLFRFFLRIPAQRLESFFPLPKEIPLPSLAAAAGTGQKPFQASFIPSFYLFLLLNTRI